MYYYLIKYSHYINSIILCFIFYIFFHSRNFVSNIQIMIMIFFAVNVFRLIYIFILFISPSRIGYIESNSNKIKVNILVDSSIGSINECIPTFIRFILRSSKQNIDNFTLVHEHTHFKYKHFLIETFFSIFLFCAFIECLNNKILFTVKEGIFILCSYLLYKDVLIRHEMQADLIAALFMNPNDHPNVYEYDEKRYKEKVPQFNILSLCRFIWKYSIPNEGLKRRIYFSLWVFLAIGVTICFYG